MQITFKNTIINYTITGSGNPLLLLHGWGGSTKSLACFENYFTDRCVINLDFPPFGKSEKLSNSWTVCDYADMVENLLTKLSIKEVDVIAHSFGGRVAILLASRKKVKKLVLISSAGIRINRVSNQIKVYIYKIKKQLVKLNLIDKTKIVAQGSSDFINLQGALKQTFINVVNFDERKFLHKIECPTLLIWGNRDEQCPIKIAKILKRRIKDSGLVVLKGGHFVYCEQFDTVLHVVKEFL